MSRSPQLPKLAHSFFKWYCQRDRYEELHGDLEEIFDWRFEKFGERKARLLYWVDVIKCFQPYAWKKPAFTRMLSGLSDTYSLSFHRIRKNPVTTSINLIGLSIAISIWVLAFAFAQWVYNENGATSYEGNIVAVIILSLIALIMFVISSSTYLNLLIHSIREKIQRSPGNSSVKRQIFSLVLGENSIVVLLAMLVGGYLGIVLIIPWFEQINSFSMGFSPVNKHFLIFVLILSMVIIVLTGLIPALYISGYGVIKDWKLKKISVKKNFLTHSFLTIQWIMVVLLNTSAIMFIQNVDYIESKDWGYNARNVIYVQSQDGHSLEALKLAVSGNSAVVSVSESNDHIGMSTTREVVGAASKSLKSNVYSVDENYLETLGLQWIKGNGFSDVDINADQAIVVNETFVSELGSDQPIGLQVDIGGSHFVVVGVVQDFHSIDFSSSIPPSVIRLTRKPSEFLSIRVSEGSEERIYEKLRTRWAEIYPDVAFQGGIQSEIWNEYFEEIRGHSRFWIGVAIATSLLALLGLLGVTRVKQRRFRKILERGAFVHHTWLSHIRNRMIKQYLLLIALTVLIGAPISYILIEFLFDSVYEYHIPMNLMGVLISLAIVISSMLLVQVYLIKKIRVPLIGTHVHPGTLQSV